MNAPESEPAQSHQGEPQWTQSMNSSWVSAIKHKIINLLYYPIEISEKLLSQPIFSQQILPIFIKEMHLLFP